MISLLALWVSDSNVIQVMCLFHCRCVLNWFGDWSTGALYQVGYEFTNKVDLDKSDVSGSRRAEF